jgi:chlorophyllide a reductase subunit Z
MQEVCNALFDALFFILPLSTMMDKADATPSRLLEAVGWEDEARSELDRIVDKEPVLVRISAAKRLRDAAERAARDAGEKLVTVDRLRSAVRLYEAQAA